MTRLDDFKLAGTTGQYDWDAYHKAAKESGDECSVCGHYMLHSAGVPTKCRPCVAFEESTEELEGHDDIRCPGCRSKIEVSKSDQHDLYNEGLQEAFCDTCELYFNVSVTISYTYDSPAMLQGKAREEWEKNNKPTFEENTKNKGD